MSAHRRCIVFGLGVAIALAAHVERAQAIGTDFDRFLVTDLATGAVLLDTTVSPDGSAHFAAVRSEFGGGALRNAVTLIEPAGQPPGENPIYLPGTSLVVSDTVVFVANRTDVLNPWILELYFLSDGLPFFELYPSAPVLEETGNLQDLTSLLHSDLAGWRVQVQSDVIPEPGTGVLAMAGLLGLAIWRRRQRHA